MICRHCVFFFPFSFFGDFNDTTLSLLDILYNCWFLRSEGMVNIIERKKKTLNVDGFHVL